MNLLRTIVIIACVAVVNDEPSTGKAIANVIALIVVGFLVATDKSDA